MACHFAISSSRVSLGALKVLYKDSIGKFRFGVCWVWGAILTLNFRLWIAQKLHTLHGALVTFNFHFPQTQKVFVFMIFGPSTNVLGPQNPLFLSLAFQKYFKTQEIPNYL